MPRHTDRMLAAFACALASGGWLCDNNVANRCPGALTCEVDIANVCCPFGSSEWCDGCAASCLGNGVYCNDEAHILDCSFNATIDSAFCGNPTSTQDGVQYTLSVSGTLMGCGQETALFEPVPLSASGADVDCGSWDEGVYGGCVPPSPDTTTTAWTYSQQIAAGSAPQVNFTVKRAHGSAPALATMSVPCTGS